MAAANANQNPTYPSPPAGGSEGASATMSKTPLNRFKSLWSAAMGSPKKKVLIGLVIFAAFLVVLLAIVALMKNKSPAAPAPSPSPTGAPQATSSGAARNESKYASDQGVSKIENDIKSASDDLTKTTVREDNLRVPSTDFNISF